MNNYCPVTISKSNCENCFRCVRECEVKAIKFNLSQPQITSEKCVACGNCIDNCPSGFISIDSHATKVQRAIKNNSIIIASLSPGWITEFKNIEPYRMIEALRLLGFTHVSETSIGATLVKIETAKILGESGNFFISNTCPAVTKLIKTYYPELTKNIIEVVPPAVAHARYLKQKYGSAAVVVTIDSCIATKTYTNSENSDIYASLTFEELRDLMTSEGVEFDFIPGNKTYTFEPFESQADNQYILPRGVYNHHFLSEFQLSKTTIHNFSGISRIKNILSALLKEDKPKNSYIELFACKEGCMYGAGSLDSLNFITKRMKMSEYEKSEKPYNNNTFPIVYLQEKHKMSPINTKISQEEISDALETLFIERGKEPKNCGGCGYPDCYSFAIALAEDNTKAEMCVYYQKQLAQNKFTMLLSKMPSGVAVVGSDMKIIEANRNFATMLGADSMMIYDANPGMAGADITRLLTFHIMVSDVLKSGMNSVEKDVQI
ncbi:MAG: [Fe-Fe] hydrogenase large subunit C-terminal domain-containing protein, partial [Rikenellaceae bacterium]